MCSNSVKLESARKWHRRLGRLNLTDVARNAPKTLWQLVDVCNVCAITKITEKPVPRGKEAHIEAGDGVHRRDGSFQSRVIVRVPALHY